MAMTSPEPPSTWRSIGALHFEAQMAASLVVVGRVLQKDADEMTFTKCDDLIGALAANRSDDALPVRVLPRRFPGADHLLDIQRRHLLPKHPAVDRVPVAMKVSRHLAVAREGFDDLLCGPFVCGVAGTGGKPGAMEHRARRVEPTAGPSSDSRPLVE